MKMGDIAGPRMPGGEGRGGRRGGGRAAAGDDRPKAKFNASTVGKHMRELMWPRRRELLGGLALLLVGRLASLVLPWATKYVIDDVVVARDLSRLKPIVAIAGSAVLVQGVTSFLLVQLLSKSAQHLIAELRVKVQRHVGRLPVAFYDQNKVGGLVSRIMTDVEGVRNLVGTGLVELIGGLFTAVVAFVLLMKINATLTLLTLAFITVFGALLSVAFARIRPIFRERGKINAEVTGRLTETLGGIRVVKGFRAEEREAKVFADGALRLFENVRKTLTATSAISLASTVLMGVVSVTVLSVGGRMIVEGRMTVGDFFAYTLYLALLIAPVFQIVAIGSQLTEAFAGLDRMDEVLAETPEDEIPGRVDPLGEIRGEITFEDVWFEYEADRPVIKGVSLRSDPGTVTALVGSSGSGKSTIIGLVAAFTLPTKGRVSVDGRDLAGIRLGDYRAKLGVVLQDSFLFDGSIRENIAFARPDAAQAEIDRAVSIAHVDEFASRFPEGLDTIVGERGVKLSGGQRQRVSIARAVLADPRILILDEATSSLDSESEAAIQDGLRQLMAGRTTFVIAHRLSTIRSADQILVVEGGEIVERGKHDELLVSKGRYHELYTKQAGLEANRFVNPGEVEKEPEAEKDEKKGDGNGGEPSALSVLGGRVGG